MDAYILKSGLVWEPFFGPKGRCIAAIIASGLLGVPLDTVYILHIRPNSVSQPYEGISIGFWGRDDAQK